MANPFSGYRSGVADHDARFGETYRESGINDRRTNLKPSVGSARIRGTRRIPALFCHPPPIGKNGSNERKLLMDISLSIKSFLPYAETLAEKNVKLQVHKDLGNRAARRGKCCVAPCTIVVRTE
jgi:hypothetical protein